LKTKLKALNSFLAVILALLIIPFSTANALTPDDTTRTSPGDISSVVQVDDFQSGVTVTKADDTVISPDSEGNYANVPGDSKIKIHYEFSLPDNNGKDPSDSDYSEYSYLSGDTYTVSFPAGLKYQKLTGVPLYTDDTKTTSIGTLSVDTSGKATVTFNNYIATNSEITGWFDIDGTFLSDTVNNGTPITIQFASKTITITPQIPAPTLALTKKGSYDAVTNQITWKVTVTPPAGKSVANVSLEDVYGSNQTYVPGSFSLNNTPIDDSTLTLDDANNKVIFNFPETISSQQVITYQTAPAADAFSAETAVTKSSTFQNMATLKVDDLQNGSPVTDKVTLDWISKNSGGYNNSSKTISWSVKAGIVNQKITGAMIADQLPTGLELQLITVKWQAPGSPSAVTVFQDTVNPTSPEEGKFGYDSVSNTLRYNAGTLVGQGALSYTTAVTDPNSDLNLNGSKSYSNKASLTWTESVSSGAPSDAATATVGSGGLISKSGYNNASDFDYNHPVIHWKITVNRNQIDMPANTVVSDTIKPGQKFLPGTFQVDSSAATPDAGYTDSGFSYTFSGVFSNTRYITYDTEVIDPSSLYTNDKITFQNDVQLQKGTDIYKIGGAQQFNSQILDKSIAANYDYDTHQVTWKITVNRNHLPMTNAKVTDEIPAGMTYVAGSLTVDGAEATPDSGSTDTSVSYTFPVKITEQHIITLITQLPDDQLKTPFDSKKFTNKANLKPDELTVPVSVSKDCTINNPIITKNANYTSGNDYIDWTVEINKAQIDLGTGIALTDDLVSALELETDTVKIYPATVNPSDGTLIRGSTPIAANQYMVQYNTDPTYPNRFTLTFKNEVNSAYVLAFTTGVLPTTATITNKITLNGMVNGQVPASTANQIQIDSASAGGGGSNGGISIIKTDPSGNFLSGATFELLNIAGDKITEKTTSSDGKIEFDNLQYRTFYIRETQAPAGYLLNKAEQRVRLSSTNPTFTYTAQNEKALGTISFQKVSEGGALLSGGTFRLIGTDFMGNPINLTASSSGGTVSFQNVPIGTDYEIREITPPGGFVKSTTVITASVVYNDDQTGVVTNISQDSLTNAPAPKGGGGGTPVTSYGVTITKTDEAGKPLAGAEFTLYNSKGEAIAKAISNNQGAAAFDNLPEGAYTARETKAPEGYEINTAVLNITVNDTTMNAFTVVDKVKSTLTGTVQIKKTDESGHVLAGAVFTLYDAKGAVVKNVTTDANGLAVFKNIPQGDYSLYETHVPEGYAAESNGGAAIAVKYGQTTALTIQNKKIAVNDGLIQIKKSDVEGNALSGTEFTLYDSHGKVLQKLISGLDGLVAFTGLKPGNYSVKETTAPKGYKLFNDPLEITLKTGQTVSYTLRDTTIDEDDTVVLGWTDSGNLPKTGGIPITAIILAFGILLVLAGIYIQRHYRKRYESPTSTNKK